MIGSDNDRIYQDTNNNDNNVDDIFDKILNEK